MGRAFSVLPDFTRWTWTSDAARAVWENRIAAISRAWVQVESRSVLMGRRASIMSFPAIEKLPEAFREAATHGLLMIPLEIEGAAKAYSSTSSVYKPGKSGRFRVVVTRPELAGQWVQAYQDSDEAAIGRLLGYPACCTEFYKRVWVEEGHVDTTLAMAVNGTVGPPESNILLRWLNVRLVPHLPCSFDCHLTNVFGLSLGELWTEFEFEQEYTWAKEMLSWPIEWNALHGVAEIRTPILTIVTRTDWTPDKQIVRREGTSYPKEGASGLRFPYRIVKDMMTGKPAFVRSATPVWELNGFSSAEAMERAHKVLLRALKGSAKKGTLLDLGCGNGRFLEWAQASGWTVSGVEVDNVRAGAGTVPIRRGDMFDPQMLCAKAKWDVVMVMPGRLLENFDQARNDRFLADLRRCTDHVLLYAYGDWLKDGGLRRLAADAGFGAGGVVLRQPGVEAMLIKATDIPTLTLTGALDYESET